MPSVLFNPVAVRYVTKSNLDAALRRLAEFPPEPDAETPGSGATHLIDPTLVSRHSRPTTPLTGHETPTLLFMSDSHIGYENRTETGRGGTVSWVEDISTTDAFNTAAAIAMVSEAQAIVHTGDILDHEVDEPRLATVETTLSTLDAKGVLVYCILGSHDRDSRHAIGRRSVDGVEILREWVDNIYLIELNTSPTQVGTSGISLYGISAGNIGLADIGTADSLEWAPDDVEFAPAPPGPNILCLHNRVKTYKNGARTEAINLDRLLSMAAVSFDCVLIGDEHRPLNQDFEAGYEFHAQDGTPILYTGPTERIGAAYADHDLIVTELTVQDGGVDIM